MARVRIDPPIVIDELTIREYRMDDLAALDASIVRNREYLLPWIGPWIKAEPIGIERRRALLEEWVGSYATGADNPVGIFIGDDLVGGTGLHDRNAPADVEIGYWVDEAHQKRGMATRVSAALVARAFENPAVDRILIKHDPRNLLSRRIPEKLGFTIVQGDGNASDVVWELRRPNE